MRQQHDGNAEPAGRAHDLLGDERGGLFFYLDEIGAAVAQQRFERAASVAGLVQLAFRADAAGREREDLEAALPLPGDVDRPAEPGIAPALRDGDGDLETARSEGAQFSPVGGL
jgi:hypothetical protein